MKTKTERKQAHADRKAGMGKHKKFWHGLFKYDPATAVPRSSALVAHRINLFGSSIRLLPAFLTHDQLVKDGFDLDNAERAKKAWGEASIFWYRIGGNPDHLKQAIINGSKKKAKKLERQQLEKMRDKKPAFDGQFQNVAGADDVSEGAYIIAGLPLVTAIVSKINFSGAKKNPYLPGKEPVGFQEFSTGAGGDLPYYDENTKQIIDPVTRESGTVEKTIFGIPKVPFIVGTSLLSALAITLGVLAYRNRHSAT